MNKDTFRIDGKMSFEMEKDEGKYTIKLQTLAFFSLFKTSSLGKNNLNRKRGARSFATGEISHDREFDSNFWKDLDSNSEQMRFA